MVCLFLQLFETVANDRSPDRYIYYDEDQDGNVEAPESCSIFDSCFATFANVHLSLIKASALFMLAQTVIAEIFSTTVLTAGNFGMTGEASCSTTFPIAANTNFLLCISDDNFVKLSNFHHSLLAAICLFSVAGTLLFRLLYTAAAAEHHLALVITNA